MRLERRDGSYLVVNRPWFAPDGMIIADVTADVQRLIDEATKELRGENDYVLAQRDRTIIELREENATLRKQRLKDDVLVLGQSSEIQRLREENEKLRLALATIQHRGIGVFTEDVYGIEFITRCPTCAANVIDAKNALNRGDRPER